MSARSKARCTHTVRCPGCADLREQLKHAQESADVRIDHERKQLADDAERQRKRETEQRERDEAKARWVMQGLAQGWLIVVERDGAYEFDLDRRVCDWTRWLPVLVGSVGWALARAKGKSASPGAGTPASPGGGTP